ncbi:hypothetical protein [Corallibacter sp.]|uniref:hypothetical protein n=1 Tax=Corallibacter sp. TaxID=2038084 RepID=UPI003AB8AECD
MTAGQDKFTWNVQLAGYDYSKADQKGETKFDEFIEEFENFPWMEQLDSYQKIQSGCSPTMSVKDLKTGKDFWVSMGGDRNEHGYLIGYIYPKEKKGLFGFGKPKTIRWLEIYLTEDQDLVKNCFKLFFNRNHDQFESKIRKLEEYGQMEAKDLAE